MHDIQHIFSISFLDGSVGLPLVTKKSKLSSSSAKITTCSDQKLSIVFEEIYRIHSLYEVSFTKSIQSNLLDTLTNKKKLEPTSRKKFDSSMRLALNNVKTVNKHGPRVGDGQGGLVCCDSWGRKESDTTERLN